MDNPWTEGAQAMMKSWTDAQKLMLESWSNPGNKKSAPAELGDWRAWTREGAGAFPAGFGGDRFMGEVAERMLQNQSAMLGLLKRAAETWQALAPNLGKGDAQQAITDYTSALQQQAAALPTSMMQTGADATELWNLYLKEWQKLGGLVPNQPSGEVTRLMDRFWSAYDKTLGRALTSPTMGYSREFNAKLLSGFTAWTDVRRADADYQAVTAQIWTKAFDALMKSLLERAQSGKAPTSAKDFINLWIAVADEVFVGEFAKREYIRAQGKFLNATMAYRLRERAVMEAFMDAYGLPTRTELDETQASLYELRREVRGMRALKQDVAKLAERDASEAVADLKAELAALRQELRDVRSSERGLEANLPIENYASLSVADVSERLEKLSHYELEQVRAFELLHKNRKTLLSELDRRLQEGA